LLEEALRGLRSIDFVFIFSLRIRQRAWSLRTH
jgi:hypothetical protein